MNEDSLFTFLRYALDESADLSDSFSDMDWAALLQFGRRQAITGVLFEGVKRIPADHPHPDKGLLLSWMALAQAIERRNRKLNAEIGKIGRSLSHGAFRAACSRDKATPVCIRIR